MIEDATIGLFHFDHHIVTRQVEYPYDVIVREEPIYVFVTLSRWIPPPLQHRDIYRSWPYGDDWHLVYVPGKTKLEVIYERHFLDSGKIIAEGGLHGQECGEFAKLLGEMANRK